MGNLMLGNDDFTYYETLGGGQAGVPRADGPSAVHVAMSRSAPRRGARAGSSCWRSNTRCERDSGRAGRDRAATAWDASSRRWPEMRYPLITERWRHAASGGRWWRARRDGPDLRHGEELRPRHRASSCLATGCESRDTWRWRTWTDSGSTPASPGRLGALRQRRLPLGRIMGGPMARTWARRGSSLSVYMRTREKAERFAAEHGADRPRPGRGRRGPDAFITMAPTSPRSSRSCSARGALAALARARADRDMSTIASTASRHVRRRVARRPHSKRRFRLEAKAKDGTLDDLRGGEPGLRPPVPLFDAMGERILHVGPLGHGQMASCSPTRWARSNAAVLAEVGPTAKAAGPTRRHSSRLRRQRGREPVQLKGRPMFEGLPAGPVPARAHAQGRPPHARRGARARHRAAAAQRGQELYAALPRAARGGGHSPRSTRRGRAER